MIAADLQNGSAPLYSMTLDVGPEHPAPPRYSVTAREILSALKSNKNLRRPSWFHYDESDAVVSTTDDDVFVNAASQLEINTVRDDKDVSRDIHDHQFQTPEAGTTNESITVSSSRTTLETCVSFSSGRVSLNNLAGSKMKNVGDRRKSVEFLQESNPPAGSIARSQVSSDSEDDSVCDADTRSNQIVEHSLLRLVCPSMATGNICIKTSGERKFLLFSL